MKLKISIQKTRNDAKIPSYAHKGDAGVDLYSAEDMIIKPMERKHVPTGIKIAIPNGYEAQVRPKSGLAINNGITVLNTPGTIDSGYRGEIMVITINLGSEPFKVEKGKKIAQMVFKKTEEAEFKEVDSLDETTRNEGGFGSTGLS